MLALLLCVRFCAAHVATAQDRLGSNSTVHDLGDTPFAGPEITHDRPSLNVTITCISLECPAPSSLRNGGFELIVTT